MRKIFLSVLFVVFACSLNAQNVKMQKKEKNTRTYIMGKKKAKEKKNYLKENVIMSEDFEGGAMPAGWTEDIGAATQGWTFNADASSDYLEIPAHTIYACINDDACNCDMSNVWLMTDVIDLSDHAGALLSFEYIAPTWTDDICAVKVSTDGGTTWTNIANMVQTDDWKTAELNLSSYAGESNFKLAFYYSDNAANDDDYGFVIDDIVLTEPIANDVAVVSITPDFVLEGRTVVPEVKIANLSGLAVTPEAVTLSDGVSYNETIVTGLALGALSEKIVKFPAWAPSEGNYTLTASINFAIDPEQDNNTLSEACEVGVLHYPEDAYAINAIDEKFGSFNMTTGSFTPIGDTEVSDRFPVASEYNGFAIYRAYHDGMFGIADPESGACINFRKIENWNASTEPTGLAWDWNTGIMYMSSVDSNGDAHFGRIDTETYEYTEISEESSCKIIAIDMATDGFIYGPTIDSDKLYKIDPNSGNFSWVGPTNLDMNYGQDVSCDPITGVFYTLATYNPSKTILGTYDLSSGALTEILPLPLQMATFALTASPVSGTADLNAADIRISPNPVQTMLNIKAEGSYTAEITDITGRTVRKLKIENSGQTDVSDLKAGIYFVRMSKGQKTSIFKIIKN